MRRGPEGTARELGAGSRFRGRGAGPGVHDNWGAGLRGERKKRWYVFHEMREGKRQYVWIEPCPPLLGSDTSLVLLEPREDQ